MINIAQGNETVTSVAGIGLVGGLLRQCPKLAPGAGKNASAGHAEAMAGEKFTDSGIIKLLIQIVPVIPNVLNSTKINRQQI